MKIKGFLLVVLFAVASYNLNAQFIEDALRFAQPNGYITARAGGYGIAFNGISDDFSALVFNPAGLSLIGKTELSFGLGFQRNSTETDFLKTVNTFKSNDAFITHAGMAVPFKTRQGNAAVGIGYVLESNYNNNLKYYGFNDNSTLIHNIAITGNPSNFEDNVAYHLWLADSTLKTPIVDSLEQNVFIKESGGLHSVYGGASFDLSEYVSAGFTLGGKWGNYKYNKKYTETDVYNKYNTFVDDYSNLDFFQYEREEHISQTISGITGSIGIMGRIQEFMRFGVTVKFPTFFEVDETFGHNDYATFDNGWKPNPYTPEDLQTSYKVRTPFIYSAGISLNAAGITFSAGVEYVDVTQLEFSDALKEIEDLNMRIVQELVGQTSWGFGVEYEIPLVPIVARASFQSTTSPYQQDVAGASIKNFAVGGGIYLADNIRLDGLFRWTDYSQLRTNYANSRYVMNINPMNLSLQLTYRY